jgi:MFS family permease
MKTTRMAQRLGRATVRFGRSKIKNQITGAEMPNKDFSTIDEQPFSAFHRRAIITTGLGVFCDGYDLSSIGLVLPLVLASYGLTDLSSLQSAMLVASALLGSAIGAGIFGVLAQGGRKRFYGIDVLIMGIAAIAQAFAPDIGWLITIRFILGIGVGADYVLSPTIMGEHANAADRGRSFGIGFNVMWVTGALATGLLNLALSHAGVSPDWQWRIVLAAGAIPAFGVLYFRRRMPETPRYLARLGHDTVAAARIMQDITGRTQAPPEEDNRRFGTVFAQHLPMILTAGLFWMIYDTMSFAGLLFGPSLIGRSLGLTPIQFQLATNILFYIPAQTAVAYFFVDRAGRKPLQICGYLGAAAALAVFALLQPTFASMPLLAFIVYGAFVYAQSGPALVSSSGLLGVEFSPTRIRSVAQSVTVVMGRIGAAIITFVFPLLFKGIGEVGAIFTLVGIAVVGAICTGVLLPETRGASLEAITEAR